jgi:hypothetical protein
MLFIAIYANFAQRIGILFKNKCYDPYFALTNSILCGKNAIFSTKIFCENIFNIIGPYVFA